MGIPIPAVDPCKVNSALCGVEAGCHSINGSYVCLCQDLQPEDPERGCERVRESSTPNSSLSSSKGLHHAGIFQPNQLLHMLTGGSRNETTNEQTSYNSTLFFHKSIPYYVHTVSVISMFSAATLVLFVLTTYLWRRKKCNAFIARCMGRKNYDSEFTGSLFKNRQQYLSNPNYYSNSPDVSFIQMLRDIEIPQEKIILLETVGEGYFGKVHRGIYAPSSDVHLPVAIKISKADSIPGAQDDFEREVEIISSFDHENILNFLGIVVTEADTIPWMVFEYMKYGDLAELLRANSPALPISTSEFKCIIQKSDLLKIATQIASGMAYLSSKHFIHRDLATRNCLVGENLVVKIADFGMTRDIYTSDYYKIGGSRMLPVRWMAPESITYGKFSLETDVWSYGVVLWEIYSYGKQPYYGHPNEEVVRLIQQGILLSPPKECSSSICSVMAGCWKTDPKDRLTFLEIYRKLTETPSQSYSLEGGSLEERYSDRYGEENSLLSSVPYASIA